MFSNKNNIYFPTLNGWRAIAAFLVLFTHVERYKQARNKPFFISVSFNSFLGGLSVTFFFVLSGFLITYLLLREKSVTTDIKVKTFFWKRFLRICPLYFAVILAGYFISIFIIKDIKLNPFENGFVLNAFLLTNIAFALYMIPDILIQIWSIGTEAQFYMIWPFVIKKNSEKNLFIIFISIIIFWLLARVLIHVNIGSNNIWNVLFFRTRIDCMAIGGIFALNFFRQDAQKSFMKWIMHATTGWLLFISFFILVYISWRYTASIYQAYAILFGLIMVRSILKPIKILESRTFNYLGTISYGIYLLHHFMVYFVFWLFSGRSEFLDKSIFGEVFYFIAAGFLTVILAGISYHFFEKRFIQLKEKI